MFNSVFLFIPFVLQMCCMAVDEIYFHRQRGLTRWERVGHPLDTLTVVICFAWLLLVQPSPSAVSVYLGLSIFSCLFVTKDEPIHSRYCRPQEHWLHALLFILHPLVLLSAGLLWPALHHQSFSFIRYTGYEVWFLQASLLLTLAFGLCQLVYWNFLSRSAAPEEDASLMTSSPIN